MERQPEARTTAGRTAGSADTGLVDVPFGSPAANELQRAGGVMEWCLDGRLAVGRPALDQAVVDGDQGYSGLEQSFHVDGAVDAFLAAARPSAPMDVEHQRRGLSGFSLPEIHDLTLVPSVVDA